MECTPSVSSVRLFEECHINHGMLMQGQTPSPVAINNSINNISLGACVNVYLQVSVQSAQSLNILDWGMQVVFLVGLEGVAVFDKVWRTPSIAKP